MSISDGNCVLAMVSIPDLMPRYAHILTNALASFQLMYTMRHPNAKIHLKGYIGFEASII